MRCGTKLRLTGWQRQRHADRRRREAVERDQFLANMVRNRREAAERAVLARIKGYPMVADSFERLVAGWDLVKVSFSNPLSSGQFFDGDDAMTKTVTISTGLTYYDL